MTEDFVNFNSKLKIKEMAETIIKDTKDKVDYLDKLCKEEDMGGYQKW